MKISPLTKMAKLIGIRTKAYKKAERRQAFMVLEKREALKFYPELKEVYELQTQAFEFYQEIINENERSVDTYKRNVDRAMLDGLEAIKSLDSKRPINPFETEAKKELLSIIKLHETQSTRKKREEKFNELVKSDRVIQERFYKTYSNLSHAYFSNLEEAIAKYPELKEIHSLERQIEREFSYTLEREHIQKAVDHYINESILSLAKGLGSLSADEIRRDAMLLQYSTLGRKDLIKKKVKSLKTPDKLISDLGGVAQGEWNNASEMDKEALCNQISSARESIKVNQMKSAFYTLSQDEALSLHKELDVIYKKYEAALSFYEQKIGKEQAINAAVSLIEGDFELSANNIPLLAINEIDEKQHIKTIERAQNKNIEHLSPIQEVKLEEKEVEISGDEVLVNDTPIKLDLLIQSLELNEDGLDKALEEFTSINHISKDDMNKINAILSELNESSSSNDEEKPSSPVSLVVNNDETSVNLKQIHSTAPKLDLMNIFNTSHESKVLNKDTKYITHDKDAIVNALNNNVEEFVTSLLGEPISRQNGELRFGSNKGSLIVTTKGEKAGLWCDHQTGEGGTLLKLIMAEKNLSFKESLALAADHFNIEPTVKQSSRIDLSDLDERNLDESKLSKVRYARQLANESKEISGTLAERYLKDHREIDSSICSKEIRFLESIKEPSTKNFYPALLVVGKNKEGIVEGVQVTYLDQDGSKAKGVESAKRSYGLIKGSSIPVHEGGNMIAVAEGVETALSVASANKNLTVFSSLGSITNFSAQDFKAKGQTILICADNDPSDNPSNSKVNIAAEELSKKGFNVLIAKPREVGKDFNDVLKEQGIGAVKEIINKPVVYRMKQGGLDKSVDRGVSYEKKLERRNDREMGL